MKTQETSSGKTFSECLTSGRCRWICAGPQSEVRSSVGVTRLKVGYTPESKAMMFKILVSIFCEIGNLALSEMLFHHFSTSYCFWEAWCLVETDKERISLPCLSWAHLRKLCAICSVRAISIVVAVLLLFSWNPTDRIPPPHHFCRSAHTMYSCTCAVASAQCQIT